MDYECDEINCQKLLIGHTSIEPNLYNPSLQSVHVEAIKVDI